MENQIKLIIRVTTSYYVGKQWGGHWGEEIVSKDFTDLTEAEKYYNSKKETEDWTSSTSISIIHQNNNANEQQKK